jgi:hypothetical protein
MHFFAHRNDLLADPDRPTIVFVHAVNPFGFANNRRVNEDNVDVNRYSALINVTLCRKTSST